MNKYSKIILSRIFLCKYCKGQLLMDGCGNKECTNYYKKIISNKIKE